MTPQLKQKQNLPDIGIDNEYQVIKPISNSGHVFISSGIKGGVGKSTFCMLLIEYAIKKINVNGEIQIILIETDRSNPDTARRYREIVPTGYALMSEDSNKLNQSDIISIKAFEGKVVIVNQPAQTEEGQKIWLKQNNLEELYKEGNIGITNCFVGNGEYDSMQLFFKAVRELGDVMEFVFVANKGLKADFSPIYGNEEFQKLINEYEIPIIELPKLNNSEREFLDDNQIAFSSAFEHEELTVMSRHRIKVFVRESCEELERIGL